MNFVENLLKNTKTKTIKLNKGKVMEKVKQKISEGNEEFQGILKEWEEQSSVMTLEKLPEFLNHLLNDYQHGYGTICHAIAIGSVATAWAMDKDDQGGITGFQGSAVMFEFMKKWDIGLKNVPFKLVNFENMLYPQYYDKFQKTITRSTWEYLQTKAKQNLDERGMVHPDVKKHWEEIVDGIVPFGYIVTEK